MAIDDAGSVYTTGNFRGEMISPTGDVLDNTASTANFIARLDMAPGVGVVPITNLRTSEDGTQTQFGIVLTTRPTDVVTVSLSSSDLTEGTISVGSVTFTPSDWNIPQLITVTGVDDAVLDDDVFYNVVLGPAVSNDPVYSGLDVPDVLFLNQDNDSTQSSFASTDVPKALKDGKGRRSGITNSTLTISDSFNILDLNVQLDISHTWDEDLDVYLLGPDGTTRVELFTDVGGSGDDFAFTILDDQAPRPITSGTAPFAGRFQPEGVLSVFNGMSTAGTWTLQIEDDEKSFVGTLNSWSITFTHPVPGPNDPPVAGDDTA
ncbi:MAG: proprotein convertase P-domain-containing protein, partial [Gemmatimonadetes bacterium]|nr:proprotein convertase P-domain-containing protein [Gemmatimonadota bacterium]